MSCRLTSPTFFLLPLLLLFLLRVQSIVLARTRFLPTDSDFEFPEIDGSAVEETCRIFPDPTPSPSPTRITTTTAAAKPQPVTKKQIVTTTKKPEVRTLPKKPETKGSGAPVRPQPAPAGPITNNHPAVRLLHLLLTNSRGRAAGSLPGFIRPTSDSDELAATLPRRTVRNRWNVGFFSSSDSSDES